MQDAGECEAEQNKNGALVKYRSYLGEDVPQEIDDYIHPAHIRIALEVPLEFKVGISNRSLRSGNLNRTHHISEFVENASLILMHAPCQPRELPPSMDIVALTQFGIKKYDVTYHE